jgi:hypothetical protein
MKGYGVAGGYQDQTFRHKNKVTRAEFTAMLFNLYNQMAPAKALTAGEQAAQLKGIKNVPKWAAAHVAQAYKLGIYDKRATDFKGTTEMKKHEAAIAITRMMKLQKGFSMKAMKSDGKHVTPTVATQIDSRIISSPINNSISRAESLQLLRNMLGALEYE